MCSAVHGRMRDPTLACASPVDAVPLASGARAIREDMPQMRPTRPAGHLHARHEGNGPIGMLCHVGIVDWLPEGGPARATVKLGVGAAWGSRHRHGKGHPQESDGRCDHRRRGERGGRGDSTLGQQWNASHMGKWSERLTGAVSHDLWPARH